MSEIVRLREVLHDVADAQPQALAMIQENGFVFDKWPPDPKTHSLPSRGKWIGLTVEERWQGLAFSLYTDLCDVSSRARHALDPDE